MLDSFWRADEEWARAMHYEFQAKWRSGKGSGGLIPGFFPIPGFPNFQGR